MHRGGDNGVWGCDRGGKMKISISYPGHDREKDSQLETLAMGLGGELLDSGFALSGLRDMTFDFADSGKARTFKDATDKLVRTCLKR